MEFEKITKNSEKGIIVSDSIIIKYANKGIF